MWEKVEDRKTDKTRMKEIGRGRKEEDKKTDDR